MCHLKCHSICSFLLIFWFLFVLFCVIFGAFTFSLALLWFFSSFSCWFGTHYPLGTRSFSLTTPVWCFPIWLVFSFCLKRFSFVPYIRIQCTDCYVSLVYMASLIRLQKNANPCDYTTHTIFHSLSQNTQKVHLDTYRNSLAYIRNSYTHTNEKDIYIAKREHDVGKSNFCLHWIRVSFKYTVFFGQSLTKVCFGIHFTS